MAQHLGSNQVIDSDVLIGSQSTTPDVKLHVIEGGTKATPLSQTVAALQSSANSTDSCFLNIISGTVGAAGVYFGDTAAVSTGYVQWDNSNDSLQIGRSGGLCTFFSDGATITGTNSSQVMQTTSGNRITSSNDLPDGITVNGESITKTLWTNSTYATVANTTTQTSILGAGTGSLTIAANRFVAGTAIRLRLAGSLGTKSSAAGYLKFHFYWKAASSTNTVQSASLASSLSGETWWLEVDMTCYTTGTVGTMGASMRGVVLNSSAGFEHCFTKDTNSVLNTTTTSPIDVKVEWENADASNTITMYTASLEILNG